MYQKLHIKIKRVGLWVVAGMVGIANINVVSPGSVLAESCPELRIVFARGSGEERWEDKNYLEYKSTIEEKLATTNLNYEFIDLDYPAVGVGLDNLGVTVGAYFGAGEAYEFGASVNGGVSNLIEMVNDTRCKQTKYVIGGYSQGAMVVSKALQSLNPNQVIYAATFGDPKIYLPEGEGIIPAACRGENLSDYRMYVPDCQAYKGLLGAYIPYEPENYTGKVGTWCNKMDIFCSSHFNVKNHVSYVTDGLYEDASRVIFNKITKHFEIENHITSPHDTAFLIDSTGSMAGLIDEYKAEALRLATETLNAGGRVALYDYRDLADPYEPVPHCDFESCTLEIFQDELNKIVADGGGDEPESLLSSSLRMMKTLNFKYGSTKSLVVLTDAGFLAPDRDGVTMKDVVDLSKKIDPVNFYIITNEDVAFLYTELAEATDGLVITNFDELNLLTDYIMERYDSLPRVEESEETFVRPTLEVLDNEQISETEIKIRFKTNGEKTLVILNDTILGVANEQEITISELLSGENVITLVPISGEVRGDGETLRLILGGFDASEQDEIIPKTPNTGKR